MKKKATIILNPCAGTRQANKYFADIIDIFCRGGYNVEVATTAAGGDGEPLAREAAKHSDLVVCIGGDGTFNEVLSGVISGDSEIPVGYIPAGSTNDFASSLKLSKDILQAARDIVSGEVRYLDVGSFNGRLFSYVASFGAFTKASYQAPQSIKNALGHLAYILEGIKDIPSIKPEKLYIKTEQGVYGGNYLFGAISNSTSMGGVLSIDPKFVDMNDGEFEVLLIKAPSNILELNQILIALTTQNYSSPMLSFFSSKEVEITAEPDMPWTLDGEYQEGCEIIQVKNLKGALRLVVPGGKK